MLGAWSSSYLRSRGTSRAEVRWLKSNSSRAPEPGTHFLFLSRIGGAMICDRIQRLFALVTRVMGSESTVKRKQQQQEQNIIGLPETQKHTDQPFFFLFLKRKSRRPMDWHTCKLKGTTSVRRMNRVAHERSRPRSISWHTLTHAAGTKTQKHVDINRLSFSNRRVGREKCKMCLFVFYNPNLFGTCIGEHY